MSSLLMSFQPEVPLVNFFLCDHLFRITYYGSFPWEECFTVLWTFCTWFRRTWVEHHPYDDPPAVHELQ